MFEACLGASNEGECEATLVQMFIKPREDGPAFLRIVRPRNGNKVHLQIRLWERGSIISVENNGIRGVGYDYRVFKYQTHLRMLVETVLGLENGLVSELVVYLPNLFIYGFISATVGADGAIDTVDHFDLRKLLL